MKRKKTHLHPSPVRPLTSREMARVISGLVGCWLGPNGAKPWCDHQEVRTALRWLGENRDELVDACLALMDGQTEQDLMDRIHRSGEK